MFDSRLWIRVGKQNIVWGKTELFRTTDQFNPVDLALASLPSLEESRIALWSVRGIWSFYDVGPLKDVRLELAMNFDDFEPIDLGRCGEPYAVWLVCGKSTALWAHGVTGIGIAGEVRPPDPWDSSKGIEFGAPPRVPLGSAELRADRLLRLRRLAVPRALQLVLEERRPPHGQAARRVRPPAARRTRPSRRRAATASSSRPPAPPPLGFGAGAAAALTGGMGIIPDLSDDCFITASNLQEPFVIQANFAGLDAQHRGHVRERSRRRAGGPVRRKPPRRRRRERHRLRTRPPPRRHRPHLPGPPQRRSGRRAEGRRALRNGLHPRAALPARRARPTCRCTSPTSRRR